MLALSITGFGNILSFFALPCFHTLLCLILFLTSLFLFLSVGFYQMAKIAVTPSIVFAEFLWYRKRVSFMKVNEIFSLYHTICL
jgi:hypothetical protein